MTDELTRTLETTERDFKRLTTIVESEPLVLLFLDHPLIALAEKERVLERAIENDLTRRLLRVLIVLRKSRRMRDVYETFADIVRRELAMVEAEVRVPRPLRPEEEAVLRRAIEEWTGRRVRLDVKLDEAVIGGVRVQVSGHVIDNTLRTRLEDIKESLLAV